MPRTVDMPAAAPRRFAGDGFDYRRPASSSARHQEVVSVDLSATQEDDATIDLSGDDSVIDLTADSPRYSQARQPRPPRRLPNGMDIIIDVSDGEDDWNSFTPAQEPGSPEIEFISSRAISRPPRETLTPASAGGRDMDDIEFVEARRLPEDEARRRRLQELTEMSDVNNMVDLLGTMNGHFHHLQDHVARFAANIHRTAANMDRTGNRPRRIPVAPPRGPARAHAQIRVGTFAAPFMEYNMVGFDLGMGAPRVPEPAPPTYEAPPQAEEGFTRSPDEEDVLVCPNCGDELCAGEDELKSQVWIVKACGHVYCGECTTNRSVRRSAKGKEKERPSNTAPFKACVVEDCGKNVVHKKSMFQIFL